MKTKEDFLLRSGKNEISGNRDRNISIRLKSESNIKYQCPMKCHGEEVYDKPGICPDSKMQLIPVNGGHIFY